MRFPLGRILFSVEPRRAAPAEGRVRLWRRKALTPKACQVMGWNELGGGVGPALLPPPRMLMTRFLGKWLKIYEDEIRLFLWATALLFLIRSSSIIFNNFAETAFLKRFGVHYLPVIYVVNSITTFIIMGFMSGFMARLPGSRLLGNMLIICGVSVAGFRLVIPLGLELIYPVLFVLKALYELILGLLFWNLANDLFDTRQSKRLFPLITAGGVLGGVIGSFGTPIIAAYIRIDNLLWAYLGTALLGAALVRRMAVVFPTMSLYEGKGEKGTKRKGIMQEFKEVLPLVRESTLVKILVILTLVPNVVIPIMNYQFNFAVDQSFATEGGMIRFFGYFRGFLNIISFVILLFVGRVYGRWGLPVALMFHPFNYVIAFLAFLLRFDLFSAMYARMSTNILRTTINNPARAVLMGLFPKEYRSLIRPFLRGTVVRIGILAGSGIIMLSEGWIHPRFLSVVALVFVVIWITTTLFFKRSYSRILLDLISRNLLDMKALDKDDVIRIFQDRKTQAQLIESFLGSSGSTCLWYADLIRSLGVRNLDAHILSILREQDDATRIGLLDLLTAEAGPGAIRVFEDILDPERPELVSAVLRAAARMPYGVSGDFMRRIYETYENPGIQAFAISGLYREDPERYRAVIRTWLSSDREEDRRAGVVSAGGSGDEVFVPALTDILAKTGSGDALLSDVFRALARLSPPDLNVLARPYLTHPSEGVRRAALEAFRVSDDDALRAVIPLLGDRDETVRETALARIRDADHQRPELIIEALGLPNRRLRECVFSLLETLEIRAVEILRFARGQLERAYRNLIEAEAVGRLAESPERDLLLDHLRQKKRDRLDTVLRVLATQDASGQMRLIWRGVFSADSRQRSNAVEALDDTIGHSLSKIMVPLLEDLQISDILALARREFKIQPFDRDGRSLCDHLLNKYDWVTVILALKLVEAGGFHGVGTEVASRFAEAENAHIRFVAREILRSKGASSKETDMETRTSISIPDKILHLRGIQIFEDLSVGEMAAIASVTEEMVCLPGEDVIREGEAGETMYMIISGQVSVIKNKGEGEEIELDRIKPGDYFGEMALFEDQVRSATIRTVEKTGLLVLHKREFEEIVREYPQIALHICKVLSQRLRKLHNRFQGAE